MVLPVVGGNESKVYDVENSLRFNNNDSPHLTFTPSSAGNRRTFTLSVWFKLSAVASTGERVLLAADDGTGGNNNFDYIAINGNDKLFVYGYEGSENQQLISTQVFRDPSAWYHLVVAFDTTDGTASNRIKAYVNGNQITDFDTANYPSQNFQTRFNNNNAQRISQYPDQDTSYFDGYMCEYNLVDGSQLAPTSFGEFNTNGVWIPKKYTGSYGTNGFYLEFKQTGTSANSSGMGADTSGNDHHWAASNLAALDVTEDTCTNNFATINSALADGQFNTSELSEGDTFYNEGQGNNGAGQPTATFAFNSGKWYWEVQVPSQQNSRAIGFCRMDRVGIDQPPQLHGNGFTATNSVVGIDLTDDTIDQVDNAGSHTQHVGSLTGMSDNDIFGVAVNLDDGNFQFYRNGSTYGSSYSLSNLSEWQEHGAVPCASGKSYQAYRFNFGNPAFSISSGNTDGKYGNFEYAPPSGYYALCTKRLARFG